MTMFETTKSMGLGTLRGAPLDPSQGVSQISNRSTRTRCFSIVAALFLGLGQSACSDDELTPPGSDAETPTDSLTTRLVLADLDQPVFVHGLEHPTAGPLLYVVEQKGTIRAFTDPDPAPKDRVLSGDQGAVFLDVSSDISTGGERGLLGLAFHPGFPADPRVFVNYTNSDGDTQIEEFRLLGEDPLRADLSTRRPILSIEQPFGNHNGGWLGFGPDGYLYVATGDGGSGGDPGNRAQDLTTLLGKILRLGIDDTDPDRAYTIPPDNPFVGSPEALDEIWSYGWRNPWRCSFDPATGDFWAADVGQNEFEEVDVEPAGTPGGGNYGWRLLEGHECFNPAQNCDPSGETIRPIFVVPHPNGFSITGGNVYRGSRLETLDGHYFFADFITNRVWSLTFDGSRASVFERTEQLAPAEGSIAAISSFGIDARGELLIVDRGGSNTGEVWRVVDASAPAP